MSATDLNAYRSCYCESCHQLKKNFGIVSTAAVNYDMTFNSIILNAMSDNGVKDQNMRNGMICILGKCTTDSEILKKVAGYTLLLTKWELEDDRNDKPSLKSNLASVALGKAIRKAERLFPEYDEYVCKGFETLRKMEDKRCSDPTAIGRTFASSLVPAIKDIADVWNDDTERLFTSLGTMIYIMDAADDIDEDFLNDTFNPFLAGCDEFVNKDTFLRNNVYGITDIINTVMKDIQSSYSVTRDSMRFHQGVTDNVIYRGIPNSAKRVISCECVSKQSFGSMMSSRILRKER